ncbi:DUF47 domain-containing protein [Brevibacterium sp. JNUCC-42]|uniref:DUF47 domain-containing protein n=1 Tax=Brevibacillus laterosporus TaxID=1465 RepID=A0A502IRQ2_BRELA|nr:DUF47 domain-containing protein [Brevibacillus laterosporus]QOT00252.1 DUF47 domain-containing protein [Brevibacterium sp. JNUCC-42]QDX94262.1 DUF47 domain-containing protein [Brevibacillus laterosporus]RAP31155.1 hypothetical protein C2W64_00327 [Brevibacillus laterosporus]TPG68199.1 DUF47 domain-containing protein [Brevibacillus laterosporus]TPG88674.1 DUF47 domain-containing protein [Brevibacillus laterosporus]
MIFRPKDDKFFSTLSQVVSIIEESAQYFAHFPEKNEEDLVTFSSVMKDYEHKADTHIHKVIMELNKAFITPIEREDILALAVKLDDVLDGFEELASRLEMYNIKTWDEHMKEFTVLLLAATKEIAGATDLLFQKKMHDIHPYVVKINDLESKADAVLDRSIRQLFANQKDPIAIMQYKEIYEMFEGVADSCEDVANALETIIMRNV